MQAGVLTNPLDVAKTRLQTQAMMIQEDPSVGFRVATSTAASPELQVLAAALIFSPLTLWVCVRTLDSQCPSRTRCAQLQARGVALTVPASCHISNPGEGVSDVALSVA